MSFTSAHCSHVLCRMSSRNLDFWLSFGLSGHSQETESALPHEKESFACCVWLAPHDYRLARNDFHTGGFAECAKKSTPCKTLCKMSIKTALDGEMLVSGLCEGSAK